MSGASRRPARVELLAASLRHAGLELRVSPARYHWQTRNPYVAARERELLAGLIPAETTSVLEVGCGEGANRANLSAFAGRYVGLDIVASKLRFARRQPAGGQYVCGDALRLPFADGQFEVVLGRDVLHHVPSREQAMQEMVRVARRQVVVVEGNGALNPIMWGFARLVRLERGMLDTSPQSLATLLNGCGLSAVQVETREPLSLYRMVLHYQFGLPRLAESACVSSGLQRLERWTGGCCPRRQWGYVVAQGNCPR